MSGTLLIIISALIVLAAIVLILVVLVQNSKGGGLSSAFSSSNNIMGVRKTTDFVEKATWYLAGFIIVLSLVSTRMITSGGTSGVDNKAKNIEFDTPAATQEAPVGGGIPAPAAPQGEQPQQ